MAEGDEQVQSGDLLDLTNFSAGPHVTRRAPRDELTARISELYSNESTAVQELVGDFSTHPFGLNAEVTELLA